MTAPRTRRLASMAAAAALTVALGAGCTAGDWRYDAPPAAGVQADADDAKARNILVISDDAGQAIVLGTIAVMSPAELTGITVRAEDETGAYGTPHTLDVIAELARESSFKLEPGATQFEAPDLLLGHLAEVQVSFGDGRSITVEAPIHSSEHPDFADEWSTVYG